MAISAQGRGMGSDSQTGAEAAQSGPATTGRDAGDGASSRGRIIASGPRDRVTPLARALRRAGFGVATTSGAAELLRRLAGAGPPFDAVCLVVAEEGAERDEHAPLAEVLPRIGELQPGLAVVAVAETQGAIRRALAAGASFVLRAGATGAELRVLVAGAVELTQLRRARAPETPDAASPTGNPRRPPRLDLRSIERAASMINSTADLEQVLPQICRAAVELFEVDHSGLVVFDETGDSGTVQAEYPHQGAVGLRIAVRGVPAEERLFYERQPIVIDDVERAAPEDLGPVADVFARFRIRSILIVPIVSAGRVLGSFSLDAIARPRPFSDEDVELSRIFAAQIATALDKARLVLKARQQADQLETLQHITFAVIAERDDPRRLLRTIVARAVELLRGRGGGIYVHDELHGHLELAAAHGHAPGLLGARLQVNEGMAGVIVAQQLPFLIVQDYANWPGRACTYAEDCPFEAVIAVPLSRERRILGVLFVDAERWRIFTAHDAGLLRFFADHAAIALDHAALLHHIQHTHFRLEWLVSALREIAALDTPRHNDQLRQIVQRATASLDAAEARLTRHGPLHPDRDGPNTFPNAPGPAAMTDTEPRTDGPLVHAPAPNTTPAIGTHKAPGFQGSPGNSADIASLTTQILRLFADLAGRRGATGNGEAAWRALFAALPGALLWCDLEGHIVVATEAAAGLLGQAPGELTGQPLARFLTDERAGRRLARFLATATSEPVAEEIVLPARSGATLPAQFTLTTLASPGGERQGILARLEDAMSPRAAEERLRLLIRASQALTSADGPLEALRNLADLLVASLGLASCRVFLLDQQGQLVAQAVRAAAGLPWRASAGEVFRPGDWPDLAAALAVDGPTVIASEGDSAWLHAWLAPGVAPELARALALAPLRDRHELVGLLEVGRLGAAALGGFSETERQVLGEIARHVAPLIDRLRLQERAEYHRMRLVALEHASRVLRVDSDPGQLQAEVLRLAVDILQQTQAVLYTVRPQLGELEIVEVHGLPATLVGRFQPIGAGLAGRVAATGTPALSVDEPLDALDPLSDAGLRHALAAPIEYNGERRAVLLVGGIRRDPTLIDIDLGILAHFAVQVSATLQIAGRLGHEQRTFRRMTLDSRAQRFTRHDRETAELFANYAALVLSQADLFESLRLANQRLDAAQTTVRLVVNASAPEDIGQALRSLVAGTRRLLAADSVVLYACDPEQRALTLPPVTEGVTDERHVAHKPRVLRDSLVAQVMRRQGVLIVEEVVADPRFSISNFVRREGIVACIAGPLAYGGRCVGAMFANYRRPHRFSEEEIGHFALLADQAAIAIRNHQLYREHQRRIFTLETIQHAGQAVTGAVVRDALGRSPLGVTLNRIVEQSLLLISPEVRDRSFSHLAMVEGTRLRFTAACPAERLEDLRQRIGDLELSSARCGVTGRAVRLKRTVRVDNVHADPDYICYDPAVTSELAVPIMLGQRVIGVINLEHPSESAFDVEDERALQALADYAAIAIQNARLYACLETVEDIGRNVAMSANVDTLLADLCRRLQQTMFPACLVRILLRDPDAERPCLIVNPALSSGEMTGETRTQAFGEGICGHVAQQRAVALRNDLHDPQAHPAPVEAEAQGFPALAELCVPIIWGETTLGVLDVQSPCREAFGHDDVQALEIVAAQIAATLHHARYIESLHSMRGIVGGRTSLEWMRTVVNVWRHEIEDYAQNIRNEVRMVALKPPAVTYEQWVETRLSQIDVNAQRILDRSLTPALRADEGVAEVRLDDLIRRRVRELWLQERYTAAVPMPLLELQARAVVRANPELLRIAIEMLVRNAVEAMASVPAPSLRIATERLGSTARVLVRDSGPGIPPEIRGVLFKEQVRRPHRERLRGTGLLMVRAIIEAYGGRVEVLDSSAEGTTMLLELPAEAAAT